MDELVAVNGNGHVRGSWATRREEDQVAGRHVCAADRSPNPELLVDRSRELHPVLVEHVLREAAAVEAPRVCAAVPVRYAP